MLNSTYTVRSIRYCHSFIAIPLMLQIISFLSTIKQAHLTATSLVEALEKRRTGRRFLMSLWEFFNGEDTSSDDISLEERKRVPVFLANAQQQLIDIFQVGQVLTPTTNVFKHEPSLWRYLAVLIIISTNR